MTDAIRVLLVDDHPLVLQGLRTLLAAHPDIVVVAEARHGQEAVVKTRDTRPDVVVMDLNMPGKDGITATREILETDPDARILMLTNSATDEQIVAAMRAGVCGLLLKDVETEQVVDAIRSIQRGLRILNHQASQRFMRGIDQMAEARQALEPLTTRELEVLGLVAEGLSNREIAARLHLASPTVTTHVRNILGKLHVHNRTQAAMYARTHRLI